ncbi:(S)-2,3-di-O-geranylgeranylglyceryl phosphate synthase [Methanosarcina sp. MTP4]|uniref:UbiA family prenyltransferase n=1 Tax=Methanosarcina sp. MTP4 TaxID=1434100 RepID=UPI000615F674|nr:UbiA family prenyltransferase [Methanosarcina sp. MTP4]AKB25545.1 (S)-2,3-di-O-geranylgeranylglyceryl phosphate synthase [Methanosarcina sp. MTP4]
MPEKNNSLAPGLGTFLNLVRFENTLFAGFSVLLSGVLSGDLTGWQPEYFRGFFVIVCLAMGVFAVNDYYDFRIDKANKRYERPLVREELAGKTAFGIGMGFLLASALLSLTLASKAAGFVLMSIPFFFLYSHSLKKYFLVKNIIAAYGFSFGIIFGSLLSDPEIEPIILFFAVITFIVALAFEIMIDIADVPGDLRFGIRTLAVCRSKSSAAKLSVTLYAGIILLDPLPFFVNMDPRLYRDWFFLALILIPVLSYLFLCRALLRDQSAKKILDLRKKTLTIMQLGSLTYLTGVLI